MDDLIHGSGSKYFQLQVMDPLKEKFMFGKEESSSFIFTGIQIDQQPAGIFLSLDHYIDTIEIPSLTDIADQKYDPLLYDDFQHIFTFSFACKLSG